jgi:hypothetical protein
MMKTLEQLKRMIQRLFYSAEILDTPINFVVTPSGTVKSKYSLYELLEMAKQRKKQKNGANSTTEL